MVLDLFSPEDPDWANYQAQSPEYLLRVAGTAVRNYVGWHLAPNVQQTVDLVVGSKGIVMLPSRHVTKVSSVVQWDREVAASDYWWSEDGWLELRCYCAGNRVQVTFDHGFPAVPDDVKAVAYELVKAGQSNAPSSNVASMSSPSGYSVSFRNGDTATGGGLMLNDDQRYRLANYRIFGLA